ncbi:hypothetical protein FIBSPDRAFT_962697 [Athelia psychrophila]|uniref:Peroxisomal ATPase PEX1 N-terminal C-lobe domain-containing protein n=1 Tax=Athelia psychrophila TaxID=1759441 RepID=A0A165ZTN0_9AGAM|nr:hypothetical protein FIBSPDRAFT_962697 [Fibularhizoctonia sp. CBS 109695]
MEHFTSADKEKYAIGLGLAQDAVVEIGLLHVLALDESVGVEPVSARLGDHRSPCEIHACHVTDTLLDQVRVAKIGQEIDVWVLGRTKAHLRARAFSLSLPPSHPRRISQKAYAPGSHSIPRPAANAWSISTPADKAPSIILRAILASVHHISIGFPADSNVYTRPERLALTSRATFGPFIFSKPFNTRPGFKGRAVGEVCRCDSSAARSARLTSAWARPQTRRQRTFNDAARASGLHPHHWHRHLH